ncbi:MAG: hypothetical protein CBB87_05555 [Micavibrio sp. TMED27]|nr:hypothetical protein [Micavibrio sp.]OUT91489.1 MAG: hypothetical protein CBB87_05555 [Micavibrio sp. TMED27]|tara:strand:- start:1331 stop:1858 length:528 start_codon:yes stop_codon:yes gene_type:complete
MRDDDSQALSNAYENSDDTKKVITISFAVIGMFISLFSFSLSAAFPWIHEHFTPPPPPITETLENAAVKMVGNIKDKVVKGIKGEEYKTPAKPPPPPEKFNPVDILPIIIIITALIGIMFGCIGLARNEDGRIVAAAMTLGVTSIAALYMLVIAAVLILILLVGVILNSIGLDIF